MANFLKIFYTLPYYVPTSQKNQYIQFLIFADIAKREGVNFEMISFQNSPGRFLTEKVVFDAMYNTNDSIFPITILNGEIVKLSSLPTLKEFSEWFESLHQMTIQELIEKQKDVEVPELLSETEIPDSCSASACSSCQASCGFRHSELEDFDFVEDLPFLNEI